MLKIEENTYLQIFVTPSELDPNLKEFMKFKLKEKGSKKIQGTMLTNVKIEDFTNVPLSRTTTNNIETNVPVKLCHKLYKPGDIIIGDLFREKRVFVIPNEILFEIVNRDYVRDDKTTKVSVKLLKIKCTSGCLNFLGEGKSIWSNYCSSSKF